MRRAMLLAVGCSAGFCVLWFLLINGHAALASCLTSVPVLSVSPGDAFMQTEASEMTLPFSVPDTCLVVEQIVLYEGPFLGSNAVEEVVQAVALLIRNTGDIGIDSAGVILETESVQLVFEADTIPAGQAVLVLEKNGKEYVPNEVTDCTGWEVRGRADWSCDELLEIQSIGMGTVSVRNRTDRVLRGIQLYYKNYLPDPGFYVGGHTYVCLIEQLEPDQSICIYPSNYANGYSRFARVEVREKQ